MQTTKSRYLTLSILGARREQIKRSINQQVLWYFLLPLILACISGAVGIYAILYFSRLGATHKDYSFESLSILGTCREAVEDNLTLLEEAGFSIEYTENDYQVISDKKGLMFILGQIISNSVKYVGNNLAPRLIFSIADSMNSEQISLSIKDNGTSIPLSDLPFVFDKGFTGDTGSYLSRSTGMGLYLVQKMATDLFITVELKNNSYGGTTVTLTFPKV